jgi:hypothetical protein
MCIELKIKAKHLALEPSIIRNEERKLKKQIKYAQGADYQLINKLDSLSHHRRWDVRNEARATQLARAYLDGKSYSSVEKKRRDESVFNYYIIPRIITMVKKYGTLVQRQVDRDAIQEWAKI